MIGKRGCALCLLLCSLLLAGGLSPLIAQETTSASSPVSINERVSTLKGNLLRLGELVKEQKLELSKALLKQQNLETALESSLLDSQRLTKLLRQSQETSTGLSQSFGAYKLQARKEIRRAYLVGGGVGVALTILAVFLLRFIP